jgi:hypothetical protein
MTLRLILRMQSVTGLEPLERLERAHSARLDYSTPAPRAHLYLAPNTATGNSVVYG